MIFDKDESYLLSLFHFPRYIDLLYIRTIG